MYTYDRLANSQNDQNRSLYTRYRTCFLRKKINLTLEFSKTNGILGN